MGERLIDINVATVEELETLIGIGHARAEAIIQKRTAVVEFKSVEELLLIPGIGRSVIDQNKSVLVCSQSGSAPLTRQAHSRRSLRRTVVSDACVKTDQNCCDDAVASEGTVCQHKDITSQVFRASRHRDSIVCGDKLNLNLVDICEEDNEEKKKEKNENTVNNECVNNCKSKCAFDNSMGGGLQRGQCKTKETQGINVNVEDMNCEDLGIESQDNEDDLQPFKGFNTRQKRDVICTGFFGSDTPHEDIPDISNGKQDMLDVMIDELNDGEEDEYEEEDEDNDFEDLEMNEDIVEYEEENMTVDTPSLSWDKKQNKRKSDGSSDAKGICPVKKSCKTVEAVEAWKRRGGLNVKLPPPTGLKSWLSKYQAWTPAQKLYALDSLISICDLNQVRHIHQTILPQFQRDFISLLPKELALYVLSFLSPFDLLRAAQTCKYWYILAADNLLWREKCKEAGIEDHMVVMDRRRKKGTCGGHMSPYKAAFMRQHNIGMNWRVNPLKSPKCLKGHEDHVITCLQFSKNIIVSGSDDNTLKVWNAATGKCMKTLVGHTGGVWSSQMSGSIIVSGSTDRMLRVWNAETGECTHTLYGHTSTVRCLHMHGKKVVSGSRDATLRVWNVVSGVCDRVLVGHLAAVRCVQYNGKLVVSGAYDSMVKVWNPDREECIHTLQGHTNRVYSLQFDGVHVVSGSLDTSIRVWDVETGQCKHTLMGHQSLTSGMELKHNILISGNADSTVKVWDIITGQCLQTLSGPNKHRSAVTCLQFNNNFVITSSDDGTVKLWDVKTGEFIRNLVALESGGSGGVVWRIRASETKLVCAVGSRNGTEETKLLVLDFDVDNGK